MASSDSTDPKLSFSASSAPAGPARRVQFFDLPRVVQDRFVTATHGALAAAPLGQEGLVLRMGAAGVLLVAAMAILGDGFGRSDSTSAILGWKPALAVSALLMALLVAIGTAVSHRKALSSLPFVPGTYLLAFGIIVARGEDILAYPWPAIARIERHGRRIVFTLCNGRTARILAATDSHAENLEEVIVRTRAEVTQLFAISFERAAARFDPFHVAVTSSPLGPQESMRPPVPIAGARDAAMGLFCAFAAAVLLVTVRNFGSDRAMLSSARQGDTTALWQSYIAAGGLSWREAVDYDLPRAELRELEPTHDLDATIVFAKRHHEAPIESEARAALLRALRFNLEKVKQVGTVTAIDGFAKRYPTGPVASEVTTARHAVFERALLRYRPLATSPAAYAAIERVVRFAEKHGSDVEVRALVRPSTSLEAADKRVRRNRAFQGEASVPSRWLAPDIQLPRIEEAVSRLATELSVAFPMDVVSIGTGGELLADDTVQVPTVYVGYSVEWSRIDVASTAPKGVFVGIDVPLSVGTRLPGETDDVVVRKTIRQSPEAWRFARAPNLSPGFREEKVYKQLLDKTFAIATSEAEGAFVRSARIGR